MTRGSLPKPRFRRRWISATAVFVVIAGAAGAGAILMAPVDESVAQAKPVIEYTHLPDRTAPAQNDPA